MTANERDALAALADRVAALERARAQEAHQHRRCLTFEHDFLGRMIHAMLEGS